MQVSQLRSSKSFLVDEIKVRPRTHHCALISDPKPCPFSQELESRLSAMEAMKDEAIAGSKSARNQLANFKIEIQNDPNGAMIRAKVAEARCIELEKKLRDQKRGALNSAIIQHECLSKEEAITINKQLTGELDDAKLMIRELQDEKRSQSRRTSPSSVPPLELNRPNGDHQRENQRLRASRDAVRKECQALTLENTKLREKVRCERHSYEAKIAQVHVETERTVRECRHGQKTATKLATAAEAQLKRDTSEWESERRKLLRQVDTARMFTLQASVEGRVMAKLDDQMFAKGICHGA